MAIIVWKVAQLLKEKKIDHKITFDGRKKKLIETYFVLYLCHRKIHLDKFKDFSSKHKGLIQQFHVFDAIELSLNCLPYWVLDLMHILYTLDLML